MLPLDASGSLPRPAAAAALLALLALAGTAAARPPAVTSEIPSDSLAYEALKRRILEGSPDIRQAAILEAAEELAREGFHAEALELIHDLEDTAWSARAEAGFLADLLEDSLQPEPAPAAERTPAAAAALKDLRSYVRSSVEYDDWDGNPVGGEVRAKLEWLPEGSFIERVAPVFAGSDRRVFAGLSTHGSAYGRILKVEAEGQAEKRLWQTYGDSLDRVSLSATAEAGTRPLGRAVSVGLPVRAELEEYREDRLGLLSRRSLGAAPTVEAVSADWRRSLLVSWEIRGCRFPSTPSSDFLRHGPFLLANWFADRFTLEAEGQMTDDRYRRDTSMFQSRAWEARVAAFARPFQALPGLKAGVRLLHSAEHSRYRDTLRVLGTALWDTILVQTIDTLTGRYDLEGSVSTVQPAVTLEWASAYSATLSLAYARGWFPLIGTYGGRELFPALYIDESYSAWKPEAVFSILSRRLFLNASLGYEMRRPDDSPHYYQAYTEVLGLGGSFSWKLSPWVEVDFNGLWRRQARGAPVPGLGMTSLSAGFISRFQ